MIPVHLKKVHPDAVIPPYMTDRAAGADIYAVEDTVILPGETKLLSTGIALCMPSVEGALLEVQIRSRSGLSYKTKLRVANSPATIDEDYLGEIKVIMDNIEQKVIVPTLRAQDDGRITPEIKTVTARLVKLCDGTSMEYVDPETGDEYPYGTYLVRKGDRIAQMVLNTVDQAHFILVEEFDKETKRGEGGFGHTGSR